MNRRSVKGTRSSWRGPLKACLQKPTTGGRRGERSFFFLLDCEGKQIITIYGKADEPTRDQPIDKCSEISGNSDFQMTL